MIINNITFNEGDEGIFGNIQIDAFGGGPVEIVYLETFSKDQFLLDGIQYIIDNQHEIYASTILSIGDYVKNIYKKDEFDNTELIKIYIFPDEEKCFGLMFRGPVDEEHGVGVKLKHLEVREIGSSEVAFI